MSKERILINQNQILQNKLVSEAKESVEIINTKLVAALGEIGVELTNEVLKDCMVGANVIRKEYLKLLNSDIKGIRTLSIKKKLIEDAEKALESFTNSLIGIKRDLNQTQFLTVENGLCVLTVENEEKMRESARIYITEPNEIEAYNLHKEAAEILNRLFNGKFPYQWQVIFEQTNGGIKMNDGTNYSKIVSNGN
ncbi:MAG: hypothetical protein WCG93_13210 [Paludibacter sp.]